MPVSVFNKFDQTIDPKMLSLHEVSKLPDVTSLAKALLGGGVDGTSLPDPSEQIQPTTALTSTQSVESRSGGGVYATDISVTGSSQDRLNLPLHNDDPSENLDLERSVDYLSPSESRDLSQGLDDQEESSQDLTDDRQVYHRPVIERKAPSMSRVVGKKKSLDSDNPQTWNDSLAIYLSEEARRCKEHGCLPPEETFFTPVIRAAIRDLCEAKMDTLAKILVYIASPHSIAVLREVLHKSKAEERFIALHSEAKLTKAERFTLIQNLDRHIIHFQLFRRHHVLELFRESGGLITRSNCGFVLTTPHNFEMAQNKSGNPSNSAEAEVTVKMMAELFPDIRTDSDVYKSKYRMVTDLRKLGQRLHILERTFGKGILGLMPDRGITGQLDFGISDYM